MSKIHRKAKARCEVAECVQRGHADNPTRRKGGAAETSEQDTCHPAATQPRQDGRRSTIKRDAEERERMGRRVEGVKAGGRRSW